MVAGVLTIESTLLNTVDSTGMSGSSKDGTGVTAGRRALTMPETAGSTAVITGAMPVSTGPRTPVAGVMSGSRAVRIGSTKEATGETTAASVVSGSRTESTVVRGFSCEMTGAIKLCTPDNGNAVVIGARIGSRTPSCLLPIDGSVHLFQNLVSELSETTTARLS